MKDADEIIDKLKNGDVDISMVLLLTKDGERLYLHSFDDEIDALTYLEQMTALYRIDMIEKAIKRGMN